MSLPSVLVLGRPNVGKSTFINKMLCKNKAITFDEPGVTRDIVSYLTDWNGKTFWLLDSGGVFLETKSDENMQKKIESIVQKAAAQAEKIIFIVDANEGLHPTDKVLAHFLRPFADKVLLAINKVDDPGKFSLSKAEFYALGVDHMFPISAVHGTGIGNMLDETVRHFSNQEDPYKDKDTFKIAFVGRPNVGKSSLLNAILKEERVIVDDKAGTTRDSVEAYYTHAGQTYVFVDTAGLRKKAKVEDGIEYYSVIRTQRTMESADLVVLVISADIMVGEQDKKIIRQVIEAGRPMIIFVNKWDLTPRTDTARKDLQHMACDSFPALVNYPFVFGSATESVHLGQLFDKIPMVLENCQRRISTPELNRFIEAVVQKNPPPTKLGRVKIFYATQAENNPPLFVFFVNQTVAIQQDYVRYVENRLRSFFPFFEGVPIRLFFKPRTKVTLDKRT